MAPVGLKHWMLHNDQLANEYDETLKLSPGYDPVRAVDPALTFHAPLLTGPDSIPGAIRATFERNSEATYQAPRGAFLLTAGDDESRHEYTPDDEPLGVLMEPASTNKCINYNADAQAFNMFLGGDPTATLSFVEDREALHAAGLNRVVGKVYKLDNSLGSSFAHANPDGPVGNTNQHIVQAYWRGTGQGEIRLSGAGAGAETVPSQYTLEWNALIPSAASNGLEVRAQPGSIIYFTLNQLEESEVPSSVIVTEGAPSSRAVDQLSWPLAGSPSPILNQTEGMAAIGFIPKFNSSDLPAITTNGYVLTLEGASFIRWQQNNLGDAFFFITDGTTDANVNIAEGFIEGDLYLVMARYIGAVMQIGYKHVGNVTWAGEQAYDGAFAEDGLIWVGTGGTAPQPANYQHARLWNIDRGIQWLEDFFSEIAN